jgi:hypothetical protein
VSFCVALEALETNYFGEGITRDCQNTLVRRGWLTSRRSVDIQLEGPVSFSTEHPWRLHVRDHFAEKGTEEVHAGCSSDEAGGVTVAHDFYSKASVHRFMRGLTVELVGKEALCERTVDKFAGANWAPNAL